MSQRTLNLGILAHVDAGKTTLTERLLHAAGVIDEVGSVDKGTTQTDTLELERARGITIRSAVVAFPIGALSVNLIDTPGHPDFIAEVERVLAVLDGAILVLSAVEGVQSQSRVLMRALRRLEIPTIVFVNKIDRVGADPDAVARSLPDRLHLVPAILSTAHRVGTTAAAAVAAADDERFERSLAETLALVSDRAYASLVGDGPTLGRAALRTELALQIAAAKVHPVYFGSASTGAGVSALQSGIAELLPPAADAVGPLRATVFKIERGPDRRKVAYVRVFSGAIRARDRLRFGSREGIVTAIAAYPENEPTQHGRVESGGVARLFGLTAAQVGDTIGDAGAPAPSTYQFPLPTLEAAISPVVGAHRARLFTALTELAEQDPLIAVRRSDVDQRLSVSLYGEVQKEVLAATLEADFGVQVRFDETSPVCIERPRKAGSHAEHLNAPTNPFSATLGLRIEPAPIGSGSALELAVDHDGLPLHLYGGTLHFVSSLHRYVQEALEEGLHGWRVTDYRVTVTACDYGRNDGPPSRRGPAPTLRDYRGLTAVVITRALAESGTTVCQPVVRGLLEVPADTVGVVAAVLARVGAAFRSSTTSGRYATIEADVPVIHANELQRELPNLTRGEGTLESELIGYEPVGGRPPVRARTTPSPLDLKAFLRGFA